MQNFQNILFFNINCVSYLPLVTNRPLVPWLLWASLGLLSFYANLETLFTVPRLVVSY